ncbi:pilus assembly protein N-terminal domain-containing protein [Aureimonas pseudogalii]|uniref:Flp pilus assembly secretin CpaC n=1 Tax=Aureimonas pseudogalii TaxID=1744844 RepID=A0A7W6H443_9HYPH|nr:pilus assembly protein N-terminal domain-containing protein [Aureimonas pseudogalii]MBB3998435.1 Flp pilus assembly secretin CpaC [Aureimonas pseudogalii]
MVFPRLVAGLALLVVPTLACAAGSATGEMQVAVDHARILKIPSPAATVIIGNPSIVDVAIHDSETLVLTGRSYGVTNVVVIGTGGEVVFDDSVTVTTAEDHSVRVYRQASRSTYSCSPQCEPKVTIGDNQDDFGLAARQFKIREEMINPKD